MNRKAALFLSVILLTQVASYSFNQITPQIDWQEPLQGDSTWEVSGRNNTTGNNTGWNNTGGNNTSGNNSSNNTSGCGNDTTLTDLWASTDSSTWGTWTNAVYGYFNVNCTIPGKSYTLEVTLDDSTGWSSYSFWNWTETNDHQYMSEAWSNLSAGSYCVNATLWDVTLVSASNYVDSDNPCFTLGSNNTGSMVTIDWIDTAASSGGGDAEISVEHSGNWTAYWGITNTNSAPTLPLWNYNNGWWDASASGGLGTTTGSGDLTWLFQNMDEWGALAPPSCNVLMVALFDGSPGVASAQSTPAIGDPVGIDYQTFELGNINASDCNWDSSWTGGNNTTGNNTGGNNTGGNNTSGNNMTYTSSMEKNCWNLNEIISIKIEMHGINMTEIVIEWEITDNLGILASGADPVIVNENGTVFYTWEYVASSTLIESTSQDFIEIMINPADPNLDNLFSVYSTYTIEFDCDNNTGGNNTGDTGGNNTNVVEYSIFNMGPEDCVQSGDELHITMIVYAGPNEDHTLDWQIVADNGVVTSWHSQDVTTSSNGSAIFVWSLDTTNLSNGDYSLELYDPIDGSFSSGNIIYFDVGCTGCGYDSSFTNLDYQIWSENFGTIFSTWNESIDGTSTSSNSVNDDTPQIIAGSNIGFWGEIECVEFDQSYLLNYTVTNSANLFVMGGEEYFNNSGSTWYWFNQNNISTALLPADEYCITVTLYVSPYGSSDIIVTYTDCVEIVALEDWDGCGSNLTYLEHMQTVSGNPFVQQNVVFLTTSNIWVNNFVDCLVIGENYTMETVVTSDGNPYLQFSDSFTVNQFSDITQWDWQTISDSQNDIATGNYCVDTTIYSTDSTYTQQIATVSSLNDCFAVVNATVDDWWGNQDNGTGNGSGTPNDPVLPDTNCSELNGTLSGLNLTNSWNITDCENGTGFWFNLTVNGTGVTWYDPIYAVGYDYEVISGPKFSSVVVPPGYGDDKYDIYLWDGTEYVLAESDLDALTEYWFTDDGGISTTPGNYDGISKFSIRGLEISEKLDPEDPDAFVTGLSFVQDPNEIGEVILSMNPITVSDEDDDGIIDEEDNCVNTVNTNQADSDGDGVGDACEESQDTSDIDDNDSDSDGGSNVTNIIAIFTVCLVFVVLFMRGGGNDGDDDHQGSGKNYYPFDQ